MCQQHTFHALAKSSLPTSNSPPKGKQLPRRTLSIIALAAGHHLHLHSMDVKTAFLYGDLEEEVYMEQPTPFEEGEDLVCHLKKSIYGLKQASRVWYQLLDVFFRARGMVRSKCDPSVYVDRTNSPDPPNSWPLMVAVWVDDMCIVGSSIKEIDELKNDLKAKFQMSDMGELKEIVGMEIDRLADGSIFVRQRKYLEKLLAIMPCS